MMDLLRPERIFIQQTIPAERKSPACEDRAHISGRCVWAFGQSGSRQKTRPSAQYNANGLASPDIEIGLRRPVFCSLPQNFTGECDPFHIRHKKLRPALGGELAARDPVWDGEGWGCDRVACPVTSCCLPADPNALDQPIYVQLGHDLFPKTGLHFSGSCLSDRARWR
jgi:hypothetical protein